MTEKSFDFSRVQIADDTAVPSRIGNRIRRAVLSAMGIAMALTATQPAYAAPATDAQMRESFERGLSPDFAAISKPSASDRAAFAADTQAAIDIASDPEMQKTLFDQSSQVSNMETPEDRAIEKNVVLVLKTWTENGVQNVGYGTATVVADTPDPKTGLNGLLTAGHVVDNDLDGGDAHKDDPCTKAGTSCVAFSMSGEPLGMLSLRGRSQTERHDGSFQSKIHNDAVMLSIAPFSKTYESLPGVPLATHLPGRVVEMPADMAMRDRGDGHIEHIGLGKGASGSAIIRDGEIIGVASYQVTVTVLPDGSLGYDESAAQGDKAEWNRRSFRLGANLGDVIAMRGDTEKERHISDAALSVLNDALPNHSQITVNRVLVAPVYGLADMTTKPHHILLDEQIDPSPVSLYGLPFCMPVKLKTHLDPTPRFSPDMHADIFAVKNGVKLEKDHKPILQDRLSDDLRNRGPSL